MEIINRMWQRGKQLDQPLLSSIIHPDVVDVTRTRPGAVSVQFVWFSYCSFLVVRVKRTLEQRVKGVLQQENLFRSTIEQERSLQVGDLGVLNEGRRCEGGSLWARIGQGEGWLWWSGRSCRSTVPLVDAGRFAVRYEVDGQLVERAHGYWWWCGKLWVLWNRCGHRLNRRWLRDVPNSRNEHVRRGWQSDVVDRRVLHGRSTTGGLTVPGKDVLIFQALEIRQRNSGVWKCLGTSGSCGRTLVNIRGCLSTVCFLPIAICFQFLQIGGRFLARSCIVLSLHVLHRRQELTLAYGDGRHSRHETEQCYQMARSRHGHG
uniref:Uncharacterized protein n=1 Tax=Anopheles culicifacies TaxID=139723 RepID=A0A182LST0_9DIPT